MIKIALTASLRPLERPLRQTQGRLSRPLRGASGRGDELGVTVDRKWRRKPLESHKTGSKMAMPPKQMAPASNRICRRGPEPVERRASFRTPYRRAASRSLTRTLTPARGSGRWPPWSLLSEAGPRAGFARQRPRRQSAASDRRGHPEGGEAKRSSRVSGLTEPGPCGPPDGRTSSAKQPRQPAASPPRGFEHR